MRDISKPDDAVDADVQRFRELLLAAGRRRPLRDPIATLIEEMGLTAPQLHGLLWLGTDGALTMGELARRIGITEKTVTGVVDRLEAADLVVRERDGRDRRVVRARLSKAGTAAFRKIDSQMAARMSRILAKIPAQDRRVLFRILNNLFKDLTAVAEEGPLRKAGS